MNARHRPHLLATITANGFGHAVQTGTVLEALRRRLPELRLTILSALPPSRLREVVPEPFDWLPEAADFGVRLHPGTATGLDLEGTRASYRRILSTWDGLVDRAAQQIQDLGADLVLANASFLALAGARAAGAPAAALASLNWADILDGLFPGEADMAAVTARLHAAYGSAALYLQPVPAMPTASPVTARPVAPISRPGQDRRAALAARLGLARDERLVLVALGGLGDAPPVAAWPSEAGLRWIVPDGVAPGVQGHAMAETGLDWPDLLASVDAFIGKPGYGTCANVAAHALPFLYVRRPDWPEDPALVDWLRAHTRSAEITAAELEAGAVQAPLEALWRLPARPPVAASGAAEIAEALAALLA